MIALRDEAHNHGCRVIEIGASAEQLEASGKLPPTLIINPHATLGVMREELFGPLLPIIGVTDFTAVLDFVNRYTHGDRDTRAHPLALYAFSHDTAHQSRLLTAGRRGAQ